MKEVATHNAIVSSIMNIVKAARGDVTIAIAPGQPDVLSLKVPWERRMFVFPGMGYLMTRVIQLADNEKERAADEHSN